MPSSASTVKPLLLAAIVLCAACLGRCSEVHHDEEHHPDEHHAEEDHSHSLTPSAYCELLQQCPIWA